MLGSRTVREPSRKDRGSGHFLFPWRERQLFPALLRQCVAVLVLDESIKVEVRDALADASFANVQIGVLFNARPKVALQNGKTNVALVLDFVLVNDVENHVVVLVQVVHGAGVG